MFCAGSTAFRRAAASGSSGAAAAGSTSSSNGNSGALDVADIVLPADCREAACLAQPDVFGRRWKLAARDAVDGGNEPLLRLGKNFRPGRRRGEERHDAARAFERQVGRFSEYPLAPTASELLFDRQAVDRQLQGVTGLRRPSQLVVNQPERPVGEEIDSIGFAAEGNLPRTIGRLERELAVEPMLEQPLDDRYRPFRFHAERGVAKAGRRRRSEQTCALEPRFRRRKLFQLAIGNGGEQLSSGVEVARSN